MHIRSMTIEDYPAAYALWLSCPGMGLTDVDDSEKGIGRLLERNPQTCLVAVDETCGTLIGVILVGNDGRRGFIYHAAVAREFRHQGVATQLVAQATAALRDLGVSKVNLVAREGNQAGNDFWERQGFAARSDLTFRGLALQPMTRINT
ncbi:MAG: GNAT family N-acetyltransferase [Bifidobacterium sp.]|nr:GNAT family N-acetyltransferase [Bifidobacterium sp.]